MKKYNPIIMHLWNICKLKSRKDTKYYILEKGQNTKISQTRGGTISNESTTKEST